MQELLIFGCGMVVGIILVVAVIASIEVGPKF
jgi:hypothetical protein